LKLTFTLIMLAIMGNSWAEPLKISVIFLSEQKVSFNFLKNNEQFKLLAINATNLDEEKNCVPMGDGCFNPQKGYIEKKVDSKKNREETKIYLEKKKFKLKTFNSRDVNMIDCEKGNFFDIFCGKAGKDSKVVQSKLEVFVDISSSMKHVDSENKPGFCERRYFVSELRAKCKSVSFYGFDTRLMPSNSDDNFCLNYGLNNRKKAVKWIKKSKAKYLLIITDLEEYQQEFREYLDKVGAKLYGLGVSDFKASQLKSLIPDITKQYCAK